MNRGTERNSKKVSRPKTQKPLNVPVDGDRLEWAQAEIEKTKGFIERGHTYLEQEFERSVQEDGNSAEVLRLCKAFEARQDRAEAIRSRLETGDRVATGPQGGHGRGRLDLTNTVGGPKP